MTNEMELLARVHSRCIEDGDCLLWQGAIDSDGLPTIRRPGSRKVESLRRVVLEIEGRIRPGQIATSVCACKACIASDHLVGMTRRQLGVKTAKETGYARNPARNAKIAAAARARGKLSDEARAIILQGGKSQRAFAEQFGVSQFAISSFLRGNSYKAYGTHFSGLGGRR